MADGKNPQDDHIEDLLSQLQGIFGKLSRQEEEARDSTETPSAPEAKPAPPAPSPAPPVEVPPVAPVIPDTPKAPPPEPVKPPEPVVQPASAVVASPPTPAAPPPPAPVVEPAPVPAAAPDDTSSLATGIAFPLGRDTDVKTLASKLETITPKFTKVAFRLKVVWTLPYDPKTDWIESVLQPLRSGKTRALFLVLDRPLDDVRRKLFNAELEKLNVYFQEVPLLSIEKKAFYTDVLLGLVFFMDSQKPSAETQG